MGIRETLNRNPAITTAATAAIIVIALVAILWQTIFSGPKRPSNKAYFTDDDGASYFTDDIAKIPPFDHGGKTAVKAFVFQCGSGKSFIGYLQRYTPQAKATLEAAQKAPTPNAAPPNPMLLEEANMGGLEVKKPGTGDAGWVKQLDFQKASAITDVKCPDGSTNDIMPVTP